MEADRPLLLLEKPQATKAVCFGHREIATQAPDGMVAVFAAAKTLEPCQICIGYRVEFPALSLMRVSYWQPSKHPSMRSAVSLITAVFDAEPLPI